MLTIPQNDPRAAYLEQKEEIDSAVRRVLEGRQYILGQEVAQFEKEFAAYLGASEVVGTASGTDAVFLALRACGIGPQDEVITVSHTAVATVAAIEQTGARAVLVDVDPATFTLNPELLAGALTGKTRAVVPVHLYGLPADMHPILEFARAHGLFVIEDCAQAHGAACRWGDGTWRKAGSLGHAGAFSFYPTKNLGALGDGGCVATCDPQLAEKVRWLREYGWKERYVSHVRGHNSRLDELQAAILRVKLRALDESNRRRAEVADAYRSVLCARHHLTLPSCPADRKHAFHQYVVKTPGRDQLGMRLAEHGIGTGVHYPLPVHLQPAYRSLAEGRSLPVTESIRAEILSLPMFPQLGMDRARLVADRLLDALAQPRPSRS